MWRQRSRSLAPPPPLLQGRLLSFQNRQAHTFMTMIIKHLKSFYWNLKFHLKIIIQKIANLIIQKRSISIRYQVPYTRWLWLFISRTRWLFISRMYIGSWMNFKQVYKCFQESEQQDIYNWKAHKNRCLHTEKSPDAKFTWTFSRETSSKKEVSVNIFMLISSEDCVNFTWIVVYTWISHDYVSHEDHFP